MWLAGPATPRPRGKHNDLETTRRGHGFWCLSVDETWWWWLGLVVVRRSFQQNCFFPLLMCLFVSILEKFHLLRLFDGLHSAPLISAALPSLLLPAPRPCSPVKPLPQLHFTRVPAAVCKHRRKTFGFLLHGFLLCVT